MRDDPDDIERVIGALNEHIYRMAHQNIKAVKLNWDMSISRWERLIESDDLKYIWNAIDWNGRLYKLPTNCPSNEAFQKHFEDLLCEENAHETEICDLSECPDIAVLDSRVTYNETREVICQMKADKAPDLNGIPPGIMKLLPVEFIMVIISVFNLILFSFKTPTCWTLSKFMVLFKKGKTNVCGNYRGITINDYLFKIFDGILLNRLNLWYRPQPEQAGSQKGKGCIDHILTLHLLCDYAKKSRKKLFLMFIDFEKAYDKVPRGKLFNELKLLGCSKNFLAVIMAIYRCTKLILDNKVIHAKIGVKQGAATSGILFVLYIDRMIKMIKLACKEDGFLKHLHVLLLMDDTVLLSSTRSGLDKKFNIVCKFCDEYGMKINVKKTNIYGNQ